MGVVNAPRATGYDACVQQTSRGRMVGLAGTLLLAVSAWLASPWGLGFAGRSNPLPIRWAHTLPAALGVVLLFAGWLMMRGTDQKNAWRTFAVWCLPLLVCPPLLSKDVWAYLEQGWLVLQGFDPYHTALSSVGGPFASRVDTYWKYTTTVYPPLALLIQAAMVAISGASPLWSLFAMRIPGLASVIAIGACLPRIGRAAGQSAGNALWFGILNPLVIVHFIGGGHNDSWAVALGVLGIWTALRRPAWWPLGCVAAGLGMAVKQPLGLMMVAVALAGVALGHSPSDLTARQAWRKIFPQALWRLPVGLAATAAGFAIPTLASGWGLGWATGSGSPQSAGSQSIAHTVAATIEMFTSVSLRGAMSVVGPIFLIIGAVAIGWLGWRLGATRPIAFTAWALIVFAFSYPSLQPWYVLWGGILLGTIALSAKASAWVIAGVGALLSTSVLLDYAGFPIPVAQGIGLAVAVLVARWRLTGHLGRLNWPFPAE